MAVSRRHNPLTAWLVGLVLIAVCDSYAALHLQLTGSEVTILAQVMALVVMPAVYLTLMYLTLKSGD
jgi:hypothetical protein